MELTFSKDRSIIRHTHIYIYKEKNLLIVAFTVIQTQDLMSVNYSLPSPEIQDAKIPSLSTLDTLILTFLLNFTRAVLW